MSSSGNKKRMRNGKRKDECPKLLLTVFQDGVDESKNVKIIYNNKVEYTINKSILLEQQGSTLAAMMQSGMQEEKELTLRISDERNIFTPESVKLLFAALSFGNDILAKSPYGLYDLMVLPLLVNYFSVDLSIAKAATQVMTSYEPSSNDVDHAIMVGNVIRDHIDSVTSSSSDCIVPTFVDVLDRHHMELLILVSNAISSKYLHLNEFTFWTHISVNDMRTVLHNVNHALIGVLSISSDGDQCTIVKGGGDIQLFANTMQEPITHPIYITYSKDNESNEVAFSCFFSNHGLYKWIQSDVIPCNSYLNSKFSKYPSYTYVKSLCWTLSPRRYVSIAAHRNQVQFHVAFHYLNALQKRETVAMYLTEESCIEGLKRTQAELPPSTAYCPFLDLFIKHLAFLLEREKTCLSSSMCEQLTCTDMIHIVDAMYDGNAFMVCRMMLLWQQTKQTPDVYVDALVTTRLIFNMMRSQFEYDCPRLSTRHCHSLYRFFHHFHEDRKTEDLRREIVTAMHSLSKRGVPNVDVPFDFVNLSPAASTPSSSPGYSPLSPAYSPTSPIYS